MISSVFQFIGSSFGFFALSGSWLRYNGAAVFDRTLIPSQMDFSVLKSLESGYELVN